MFWSDRGRSLKKRSLDTFLSVHIAIMQLACREFMLFASVAVTLFALGATSGVIIYGAAKLPKDVLNRIEETRKAMGCNAHVLPTVGKYALLFLAER